MGLSPLYERAGIEALSGAAMGAAFVYAGAKMAPTHRKRAAYALGGVGLIVLSVGLYYAATEPDYWAFWNGAWSVFGVAGLTYGVTRGELKQT
jgi:hypothetical protein